MKTYGMTRGFRNHNPCNLRTLPLPAIWKGQMGVDNNPGGPFAIFGDLDGQEADFWGLRGAARNFKSYQTRDGCLTMGQVIQRHAPPDDDNNTQAYVAFVCKGMGIDPDVPVSLATSPQLMLRLIKQVVREENGMCPYSDEFIASAIAAA